MRIAQVSPLYESVPPKLYGGTERVVSFLTEELVDPGHDVTLFASGDSRTRAELVPCAPRGAAAASGCRDPLAHHLAHARGGASRAPTTSTSSTSTSTTCHFPLSRRRARPARDHAARPARHRPSCEPLYRDVRRHAAGLDLRRPARAAAVRELAGDRVPRPAARPATASSRGAGRLPRVPRPDLAREAASTARSRSRGALGMPLKIAAKVDRDDRDYFEQRDRAAARRPAGRVHRRDRRGGEGRVPRRRARRCCSRSTGPSRSAW